MDTLRFLSVLTSARRSGSHALGVQALQKLLSSIAHAAVSKTSAAEGEAATAASGVQTPPDEEDGRTCMEFDEARGGGESREASQTQTQTQGRRGRGNVSSSKCHLTVGVVGFPNVGKSSVINALTRNASAAGVAALPGSTKVLKHIALDRHTQVIDSPGVLFSAPANPQDEAKLLPPPNSLAAAATADKTGESLRASSVLMLQSLLPVPQIPNPEQVACAILSLCCKTTLQRLYQLADFASPQEALRLVAARRGKLKKGGVPDVAAAARLVLGDWQEGRIPYYSEPSGFSDTVSLSS